MSAAHEKLAKILRAKPEVLLEFERKLNVLTGKSGVIDKIVSENDIIIERTLNELGVAADRRTAGDIYTALINHLGNFDQHLYNFLGKPRIEQLSKSGGQLCRVALALNNPPKGFFIKKEKGIQMLEKFPPENILKFFGYRTVAELFRFQDFNSVFSSLRFAQDTQWMHKFFDQAYADLSASDFEERAVEIKVLEPQWLNVAEEFLQKKYHNVSHLKEFGVIFIIPLKLDSPGETLRLLTLLLHYLNEVPFYSKLFRKFSAESDFTEKLKSLLRGDVPEFPLPSAASGQSGLTVRIVQRYLAKDDENDFRLFEPHINPEAEHWFKAEQDLAKLQTLPELAQYQNQPDTISSYGYWQGLDFVGDFFPSADGTDQLISFDLIDLVMSLVKKGEIKYLYHQQEALWNKIFIEYLGRDKIDQLVEENIINGFIKL